MINDGKERLHVYFTDSNGYNLNTDYWTGYDLSAFSFDRDPYMESQFGIESTLDAEVITASNLDSKETRKEHVKSVRSNIQKRNETINSGKCPRCGALS